MNYTKLNQIAFIIFITLLIMNASDITENESSKKYMGGGVKVAVLDSGIYDDHKDFRDKKIRKYNFINDSDFKDLLGHGTEVSGIITNIAPNVELYNLRILDDSGEGSIETLKKALDWCIKMNIDIINISFSTKLDNEDLRSYINKALKKGTLIVASYNNRDVKSFPAQYKDVIGVKASNSKVILVKGDIIYALGTNLKTTSNKGSYKCVTGNSYATAYITGVICKVMSEMKYEKLTINYDEIIKKLKNKGGFDYV
ncbi:MAG: S8 family serine peptidase [Paeniclostridium sp.]|nr:S8 family serine peptidase [Paeniclostridium sp.]MBW4874033.1 S8 family serine peptidase [Paeniclostridium sp.]